MMQANKTVVITGCTRGLGLAMIPHFVNAGWRVAGCGRDTQAITKLSEAYSPAHRFMVCDVSIEANVIDFCGATLKEFGSPDLVLNNAATMNENAPFWEIAANEFSRVIDTNVKGTASIMRHFLPAMMNRGSGIIVNFSSGWGRRPAPNVSPYCASKFAIEGLSLSVAEDTDGKVAIIPVSPGIIDTDMLKITYGDQSSDYISPEQWAEVAVPYLANLTLSDNGRSLTVPC